ncbi:MAG: TrkA family potassium uptake protein [Bacillota bacterium]
MPTTKEFVVIGLGRFGGSLASTLYSMGYGVMGIDADEETVNRCKESCTHVVQADATDEATLRSLGVTNFDVAVVSIGHDMQASILVTLSLKELGVPMVIAKASSEIHGKVLKRIGADQVVFPERDMGVRLANRLAVDNVVDYLEITPEVSIVEINATKDMVGKTLRQLDIRANRGINIVAIRRANHEVLVPPGPDEPLQSGDILVALGSNENVRRWQNGDDR